MGNIGIAPPVVIAAPTLPAPVQGSPGPTVSGSASTGSLPDNNNQVNFDSQAAEQQRLATVQRLSQQIANVFIVGDQSFTIFKDMTGQYITRYTSLRDGKVTYIPEPTLFKLGNGAGSGTASLLTITV